MVLSDKSLTKLLSMIQISNPAVTASPWYVLGLLTKSFGPCHTKVLRSACVMSCIPKCRTCDSSMLKMQPHVVDTKHIVCRLLTTYAYLQLRITSLILVTALVALE